MKNFIFKSTADFHKIVFNQLNQLLAEQRNQRHDLFVCIKLIKQLVNSSELQKQVDEYFEEDQGVSGEAHPERDLPLEDNTKDIPEDSQD